MSNPPAVWLSSFFASEEGQGVTEYGAVLAFVAILVALAFAVAQGALACAISKSFSGVVSQLNHVSANLPKH
jgi:Flp pilus assembly pilin Flp